MSGNGSPRTSEHTSSGIERVTASRLRLRRSISANVLSDDHAQHVDRPASAISPVASPVLSRQPVAALLSLTTCPGSSPFGPGITSPKKLPYRLRLDFTSLSRLTRVLLQPLSSVLRLQTLL
jgi:hypothetical protein